MLSSQVFRRTFSSSSAMHSIKKVAVIGGGLMGSGIAQVTAQGGMDVTVVDISDDALKKTQSSIKGSLERFAKKKYASDPQGGQKFISDIMNKISTGTSAEAAVKNVDLVIEAIVENVEVKQKLFKALDAAAPQHTIFATNTSSLSVGEIASATNRKDRFGGLHFFSPVPMMQLLEVVRITETSDASFNQLLEYGKAVGKKTISCKDTPGFVVNRLLVPYMMEAARMLERGDASAEDIDLAMKLGAGYPMGPFELMDFVGHDVSKFIVDGWHKKYPDVQLFKPVALVDKLVKEGKLGRKTGEGIYKYNKK